MQYTCVRITEKEAAWKADKQLNYLKTDILASLKHWFYNIQQWTVEVIGPHESGVFFIAE